MKKSILFFILAAMAFQTNASCLDEVSSFAEKICGKIKLNGSSKMVELEGEIQAELSGMVSRVLGSAGADVNGKRVTEVYENVVRSDLAKELKDGRQCRMKMVEVGKAELCKPLPAVVQNKRFIFDQAEDQPAVGIVILYPGNLNEKEAGTDDSRLLPVLDSMEDSAGLEIAIRPGIAWRRGVEMGAGITLPKDPPRFPEALTPDEHLKYIKSSIQEIKGDQPGFLWLSEKIVNVTVYSDSNNPPDRKTADAGWIIDYKVQGKHYRELHFFQQTDGYGAPAEQFGLVEIICSASDTDFNKIEPICDRVFKGTAIISRNYFMD